MDRAYQLQTNKLLSYNKLTITTAAGGGTGAINGM
jgi:hypothetical protein